MATHSSVLAWRIPGMGEPGGRPSMGSHRVGHNWSDLAAAVAAVAFCFFFTYLVAPYWYYEGFPCSSVGKESTCDAGDLGSIPGSERAPGEGNGNPLQYSCLENPMDRFMAGYGVARVGHNLVTKLQLLLLLILLSSMKVACCYWTSSVPWDTRWLHYWHMVYTQIRDGWMNGWMDDSLLFVSVWGPIRIDGNSRN